MYSCPPTSTETRRVLGSNELRTSDMAVHVLAFTAEGAYSRSPSSCRRSKAAWHIGAMTAVLCWGSASQTGLGSLTCTNTRLVDRSETPRTATNLCQSETCGGPDFISVAEALFRPSVTWRRGPARSLGTLATPTPTVSTWLEILSWPCSSATDQRRRTWIPTRSRTGTGMTMLSGYVSLSSRCTFVPKPPSRAPNFFSC